MKPKDLIDGATQGVAEFLFHHPHSVVEPAMYLIADRVAKTVELWLDSHEDEIIEAIAEGHEMRTPSMSELAGTAAEKITNRKWCGHCQTYKMLENGVTRIVKGRRYWKCENCSGRK